ncbi:MAG: hypothetical protein Tsb0013_25250 [Phycisphaerales bacterium]
MTVHAVWLMVLAVALCSAGACASGGGYRTVRDIAYYDEAPDAYAAERCRLDLYHPTDASGFATVVWLHAGGLVQGERYVPGELRERGIAVAAVDYRLSPRASAPSYIEDAASAVAWVLAHIEAYGGDPERVIVAGASAGGTWR